MPRQRRLNMPIPILAAGANEPHAVPQTLPEATAQASQRYLTVARNVLVPFSPTATLDTVQVTDRVVES